MRSKKGRSKKGRSKKGRSKKATVKKVAVKELMISAIKKYLNICTSQIGLFCSVSIGGHSDLEKFDPPITVAGQRRIYTELSPLLLMADLH